MHLDPDALKTPARHGARLVAADLLSRVKEEREKLYGAESPAKALHDYRVALRRLRSWIRAFDDELADTLRSRDMRELSDMADATSPARDYEVQIESIADFARGHPHSVRTGVEWLSERLRVRAERADAELRHVLERQFEPTMARVGRSLECYTVRLDEPPHAFALAWARRIAEHADDARSALTKVSTVGDRAEAHTARIGAKRLRYLLEPLAEIIHGVPPIVERLAELQDQLGRLHDLQVLASEVIRRMTGHRKTRKADERTPGLVALSRRLHRDERAAFARLKAKWLGRSANSLWTDIAAIADTLSRYPEAPAKPQHARYYVRARASRARRRP